MTQHDLTIRSTTLTDDGQSLHLTIVVHNPANRTRYAYASVRALRYDRTTKVLEVQLSDNGLVELRTLRGVPSASTFILPTIMEVEPKSDAELPLRLERTITRVDTARSTDVLRFETLPIHEATTVQVDVAWGDTPFYPDPRTPYEMRQQLVSWSKGVATHRTRRKPRPEPKGTETGQDQGEDQGQDQGQDEKQRGKKDQDED